MEMAAMDDEEAVVAAAASASPDTAGEWAIVELFGHTTLVGRIAEVERFGAKMLALEPLFAGALLPVVFHGGAAIYRLTPCAAETAYRRAPKHRYQLPPAIAATLPPELLPAVAAPAMRGDYSDAVDDDDGGDDRLP